MTASVFDIPLRDRSVDLVLCARLLHHFSDTESRAKLFRELARVARIGVVVSFFDATSYYAWKRRRKIERTGRESGRHSISRDECRRLAEAAGLQLLGMNAILRFHSEITSAAFAVHKDAPAQAPQNEERTDSRQDGPDSHRQTPFLLGSSVPVRARATGRTRLLSLSS